MRSQETLCSPNDESHSPTTSSEQVRVRDTLITNPESWVGMRELATLIESQGDEADARECYLGRMPNHVQQQIFSENVDELLANGLASKYIEAHESSASSLNSPSINTTERIQHYSGRKIVSKATGITQYTNASLWFDGFNTVVFNSAWDVDKSTLIGNVAPAIRAARVTEPVKLDGQVVLIAGRGSNNYFHWMTDILPKFGVLEQSGITTSANTKYVFNNVISQFKIDTLRHLGINQDQIYTTDTQGRHIQADELIIPELPNHMGLTMGEWLPDFLKKKFDVKTPVEPFRKILVSRDAEISHGRGIYNLEEFNQYFLQRGYEIVTPEKYTVTEQAKIFSEASHVVGPHGAGLTNVAFCQAGTKVYELYGEHLAPCYWAISELCDLQYLNHNCTGTSFENVSDLAFARSMGDRRSSSFGVNLSELNEDFF